MVLFQKSQIDVQNVSNAETPQIKNNYQIKNKVAEKHILECNVYHNKASKWFFSLMCRIQFQLCFEQVSLGTSKRLCYSYSVTSTHCYFCALSFKKATIYCSLEKLL